MKTKNPITVVALIPLSFIMGYQLDNVFGNKMERIVGEVLCVDVAMCILPMCTHTHTRTHTHTHTHNKHTTKFALHVTVSNVMMDSNNVI